MFLFQHIAFCIFFFSSFSYFFLFCCFVFFVNKNMFLSKQICVNGRTILMVSYLYSKKKNIFSFVGIKTFVFFFKFEKGRSISCCDLCLVVNRSYLKKEKERKRREYFIFRANKNIKYLLYDFCF